MFTRLGRSAALVVGGLLAPGLAGPAAAEEARWPTIRAMLFGEREILDGTGLIELKLPARAADAAVVPVTVKALRPQAPEGWIKTVHLIVDNNPAPVPAVFHLRREAGDATIGTRVRVNENTPVHAVAETADGKLYAVERLVKAAGGCSAPIAKNRDEVMADLGQIKLKQWAPVVPGELYTTTVLVSHPQYTGMQMDYTTQSYFPPEYVRSVRISYAGRPILEVEGDLSLSQDPAISFSFLPREASDLAVEVEDTEGRRFEKRWSFGPAS